MENNYKIELTKNEIIVLSDLIYRINDNNVLKEFFVDQSEQRVLWDLEAILEKITPWILWPDYLGQLKKARNEIRDKV